MKYLSLLLIFTISQLSFSQDFILLDKETKAPLPFVSVYTTNTGVYSDADGKVKLTQDFKETDTISIEMLGFQVKKDVVNNIEKLDTIFLESKVESLSAVELKGETKTVEIEGTDKGGNGFGGPSLTELVCVVNPNEKINKTLLNKVSFYFKKKRGFRHLRDENEGHYFLYRFNIYEQDKGRFIKIYNSEPFKVDFFDKKEIVVDVDKYVLMQENIAFGVECIGFFNEVDERLEENTIRNVAMTTKKNDFYDTEMFIKVPYKKDKELFRNLDDLPIESGMYLQFDLELVEINE
ncbi:carboxypeptidase-like regulatory domain-containing protein [Mesonia aquimarina]|uniref:carboxypeptidase-like regulatory domain-containing protein n=1 Tax=Mesonia aquimarina TaxID=1504967 RepID=UPI000EF601BE|nr:carboxypeptidase-like regulatory domain-containing protein [Mesonia aquimarina]